MSETDQFTTEQLEANKLVAAFMQAASPLETYLHQHRPLTKLQVESIELTVTSLISFLSGWKETFAETAGEAINIPGLKTGLPGIVD